MVLGLEETDRGSKKEEKKDIWTLCDSLSISDSWLADDWKLQIRKLSLPNVPLLICQNFLSIWVCVKFSRKSAASFPCFTLTMLRFWSSGWHRCFLTEGPGFNSFRQLLTLIHGNLTHYWLVSVFETVYTVAFLLSGPVFDSSCHLLIFSKNLAFLLYNVNGTI